MLFMCFQIFLIVGLAKRMAKLYDKKEFLKTENKLFMNYFQYIKKLTLTNRNITYQLIIVEKLFLYNFKL